MKRFLKSFRYGQKGFTLVELLIVIAILGILAAVAIPNLLQFIGTGEEQAQATELDVVQTAVIAAMADQNLGTITGGPFSSSANLAIGETTVGDWIIGGYESLGYGPYTVGTNGDVTVTTE